MADADRLLELIEQGIAGHGGDLGGWTRLDDDRLQLFDGRVTLRAHVDEVGPGGADDMVHSHVLATLHEHDDEVLDACVFGTADDRKGALAQAALIWITCVAGPIRSFLDNKPVCMTCQAGVVDGDASKGYVAGDYGLRGLRSYVGPAISRGFDGEPDPSCFDDKHPWFRFAAESAAPRRVHLAKATVFHDPEQGWYRALEIDGHDVSYKDSAWPSAGKPGGFGYHTRFAVFEFPRNSAEIRRRTELERTIRHFATEYSKYDSVDRLMQVMVEQGFDADLTKEVETISTIAFGRMLFEPMGFRYSETIIRARRDGRVQTDVPLMSLPAYTRARALTPSLRGTLTEEQFQALALYDAQSGAIVRILEAHGNEVDPARVALHPCVVPERGASDETMNAALAVLDTLVESDRKARASAAKSPSKRATGPSGTAKKPWWKFW